MAPMKKLKIREESQTEADNIGIRTLIVSDGSLTDNGNGVATLETGGGDGAPINSPTFTGVPAAPTAAAATNTTQIATTAFVTAAVAAVPSGSTYPLDVAPASPHAKDDEFTAGTLDAKWTSPVTSTQAIATSFSNGWITIEPNAAGTASTGSRGGFGIRQNAPAGSFTISAKIAEGRSDAGVDDSRTGIFCALTGSDAGHIFGRQSSIARLANVNSFTYSESADWGAAGGLDLVGLVLGSYYQPIWYKIAWVTGTSTLTFSYSLNGVHWFVLGTRGSQSQPTRIGIAIWSNSADTKADHKLGCDWFRVTEP